jgi:hypothetical protein
MGFARVGLRGAYQSVPSWLVVLTLSLFCRLTCHFILHISAQNSLTGTIPTEIGMMTSLEGFLSICKLSSLHSVAFARVGSSWSTPIIFQLVGCAHIFSVPMPYLYFFLQISVDNSLTGTIPTEIGMLTSLTQIDMGALTPFTLFRWAIRPCWGFLERIPIIFELVGCAHNVSVLSPYTCHFILQISDANSLTGTIPTEIGMMTSLVQLYVCTCPA